MRAPTTFVGTLWIYGRKYMGIVRSAFVVDPKGKLAGDCYKVSPKATIPSVTKALEALAQ